MQTLKTAVVVVLLLVVFYGVYEMLNRPPVEEPPAVASLPPEATADLDINLGDFGEEPVGSEPSGSFQAAFDPPAGQSAVGGMSMSIPEPATPPYLGASVAPRNPGGTFPDPTARSAGAPNLPPRGEGDGPAALASPVPSQATQPLADGSVYAIPGGAQLQNNPFVREDMVPRSEAPLSDTRQLGARAYQRDRKKAELLIAEHDYRTALETLSVYYKSQDLTADEHRELLNLLDPLAGRVIYSREHLLERPYTVRRNETLMDIAQQCNVPYQVLQKINGIENPQVLLPGSELKIMRGPFRAEVDLQGQELTLFLDRLYAGRFPVTLGIDPQPMEGEFQVREKRPGKAYFSLDGRTVAAENPANPFGHVWLDLGREVCIHGSPGGGMEQKRGCISLSPRDAEDVYSILSVGSQIRILR